MDLRFLSLVSQRRIEVFAPKAIMATVIKYVEHIGLTAGNVRSEREP